jgi:hypothetical protein
MCMLYSIVTVLREVTSLLTAEMLKLTNTAVARENPSFAELVSYVIRI